MNVFLRVQTPFKGASLALARRTFKRTSQQILAGYSSLLIVLILFLPFYTPSEFCSILLVYIHFRSWFRQLFLIVQTWNYYHICSQTSTIRCFISKMSVARIDTRFFLGIPQTKKKPCSRCPETGRKGWVAIVPADI